MQFDFDGDTERVLHVRFLALFKRLNRGVEHGAVKVETDFLHFAALCFAQTSFADNVYKCC